MKPMGEWEHSIESSHPPTPHSARTSATLPAYGATCRPFHFLSLVTVSAVRSESSFNRPSLATKAAKAVSSTNREARWGLLVPLFTDLKSYTLLSDFLLLWWLYHVELREFRFLQERPRWFHCNKLHTWQSMGWVFFSWNNTDEHRLNNIVLVQDTQL